MGVGKGKLSKEVGWSLIQELFDDLGMVGSDVVKPELVCFIVDG